jgi:threonine/homoserine/homoserine lactone efflux protein
MSASGDLGAFLLVATIVVITPGVDMAVVTRNALLNGRRAAVLTALGINLGVLFWVTCRVDDRLTGSSVE